MKKSVTFILLILFLYQNSINFWTLISFHANQEYIAKNECINRFDKIPVCYGKCVLKKQLKDTDQEQQRFPDIKEKEIQPFVCPIDYISFSVDSQYFEEMEQTGFLEHSLIIRKPFAVFHPPKTA